MPAKFGMSPLCRTEQPIAPKSEIGDAYRLRPNGYRTR